MRYGTAAPRRSWLALTGAVYASGVAVRIAWANAAEPWTHAPDHLAWGLLLHEALAGPVRADQLFHYPHEGWSVVAGVLAFLIARLSAMDPAEALAWAALVIDSVGRAIETGIVGALFGVRVALGFTVWSAAGSMLLIENATAAYGGHLALSPWPIVALAVVLHPPATRAVAVAEGAALGLAAAMGNQNFILLAVVLAALRHPALTWSAIGVAGALLFVRARIDLGFHLVGFDMWTIRGMGVAAEQFDGLLGRIGAVLIDLVPASFALGEGIGAVSTVALWLCAGVVLVRNARVGWFVGWVVGLFALAYAILFEIPARPFDAVDLRHLAWIAPLLAAVAFAGWNTIGRWGWATALVPLAITAHGLGHGSARPATRPSTWEGAGFTLAAKLGDDPPRLEGLARWIPLDHRASYWGGVGAGLGEAALHAHDVAQQAVDLVESFPLERRPEIAEGVARWLLEHDPASQMRFEATVWSGRVTRAGLVAPFPRSGLLLFGVSSLFLPVSSEPSRLAVLASGTPAAGIQPVLELWMDGALVRALPIGVEIRVYDLGSLPPHARVELRYTNDAVDAEGNDRNLVIHWIETDATAPER